MASTVKIHAVSYSFVVQVKREFMASALYDGAVDPPAPLLLYSYSIMLNYGPEYLEMGKRFAMFQETRARIGGIEGRAIAFMRRFKEPIGVVHIVVLLDQELSVDDAIEALASNAEVDGISVQEYVKRMAGVSGSGPMFGYRIAFLEAPQVLSEAELYGIVELDPTYSQASDRVVHEVVSGDVSMIKGIALYFASAGGTVIYSSSPVQFVRAITNLPPQEVERALASASAAFNSRGWTMQDLAVLLMPYLDYVAELELVVVEGGLLKLYESTLASTRRTKREMARIKARITNALEFYYALRYIRYYGAARAAVAASRAIGIDQMRAAFEDRMKLLSDSIEMGHQLELENWNKLLTYTIAGMSFASLTLSFIEGYYRKIFPLAVVASVLAVTSAFLIIIILLYERVTRRASLEQ